MTVDPRLVAVAVAELPGIIAWLKSSFGKAHPGIPPPTDAEVLAAYREALASSLGRDEALLAERPSDA